MSPYFENPHKEPFDDGFGALRGFKNAVIIMFIVVVLSALVINGCERQKMINKNLVELSERLDAEQPVKEQRF